MSSEADGRNRTEGRAPRPGPEDAGSQEAPEGRAAGGVVGGDGCI